MKRIYPIALLTLFLLLPTAARAESIYWTTAAGEIQRANLDGSSVEDLPPSVMFVRGMAIDPVNMKLYWVDDIMNRVQRSNLDGTSVEDVRVYAGNPDLRMIAVDPGGGKIYISVGAAGIEKANLDGSSPAFIVTSPTIVSGIGVDPAGGKIYWTDYVADKIQRANLDGSNVEDLVTTGLGAPWALAVDTVDGKVYWTDTIFSRIQRSNLDGSGVEDVFTSLGGMERSLAIGR
jgi:DNA-binding beta-propeller fold protein YncE